MRKTLFLVLILLVPVFLTQCASMQTWPTYERTAEDRMTVIQQSIGDGLKTGALNPEEAQVFLGRLEDIRGDYLALRDKRVYRNDWERLLSRIDVLEDEIDNAIGKAPRIERSAIEERLISVQRRIDDARINGQLSQTEAAEFQSRMDSIRSDYVRMTEGGRYVRYGDRAEISRRLDLLDADLSHYR